MVMCHLCHKYPLEMREVNEVLDFKGTQVIICDGCYESEMEKLKSFKERLNKVM